MNDEAKSGRRVIAAIALALIVPSVLELVVASSQPRGLEGSAVVRPLVAIAMSVLMWRGYSWARTYIAVVLAIGAVLAAMRAVLLTMQTPLGGVMFVLPPLYAWGAWALWSSSKVDAYVEHCERRRTPDMSFTGHGT